MMRSAKPSSELKQFSKFLSTLLRHKAEAYDLVLDAEGYADFEEVWAIVEDRFGGKYGEEDLEIVLEGSLDGKKRIERIDGKIRALYGHSQGPDVEYPVEIPPQTLYHGTTPQALDAIRKDGLLPMSRQYVHLSITSEWAAKVASRKKQKPIVLQVKALEAYHAGIIFHHPEEHHFLTKAIPPEFLVIPEKMPH